MSEDRALALRACDLFVARLLDASDGEIARLASDDDRRDAHAVARSVARVMREQMLDGYRGRAGRSAAKAPASVTPPRHRPAASRDRRRTRLARDATRWSTVEVRTIAEACRTNSVFAIKARPRIGRRASRG